MADMSAKTQGLVNFQRKHPKLTAVSVVAVFLSIIFPSYLPFVLLVASFGVGLLISYFIFSPDVLLPNLLTSYVRIPNKGNGHDDELTLTKTCPICGKQKCSRHRPELNLLALQPWTNVKLPKDINDALEEFFNLLLKEYVYAWYKDLSQDEAFVDEIRISLRFIVSVLLRRIQKVDIPTLVTQRVLNAAMKHLCVCLRVVRRTGLNDGTEQAVLDIFSANLHCAAHNRRTELDYLKQLSTRIFPFILPPHSAKCRSLCSLLREILAGAILLPAMDVLADPDKLNNLLLLFLDTTPSEEVVPSPSPFVPILQNYSHTSSDKNHAILHLKMKDILEEPEMLYPFMQFMKTEASVNVLQFYLSVAEFNTSILQPELSVEQLEELHRNLKDLYTMYMDPTSIDCISLDDDIVMQIQAICIGPPGGVVKLQTTTPLFKAFDHAYGLMENTFLPLFHQSDDYYMMLCGERLPTKLQRSVSNSSISSKSSIMAQANRSSKRANENLSLSRLGSRIKTAFKPTTVEEGRPVCDDIEYAIEEDCDFTTVKQELLPSVNSAVNLEFCDVVFDFSQDKKASRSYDKKISKNDASPNIENALDTPLRNLSAWRVSIPDVQLKPDPENPKKSIFVFVIDIRRVDVLERLRQKMLLQRLQFLLPQRQQVLQAPEDCGDSQPSNWTIDRRYHEFYVLDQKLAEFHGELLQDVVLPAKKTFVPKTKVFFESQRDGFESYLQKLLTKPVLRGSELVYSFLTSEQEFTTGFLEVNLGKKVKSGALKLVKERGQHLEPFLKSLLSSTESPKSRPSPCTDREADTISISSEKMINSIYGNNGNIDLLPRRLSNANLLCSAAESPSFDETSVEHLTSIYDTIVYLALHVYKAPMWFLNILMAARIMIRNTFDTFLDWYLGNRIEYALREHRIVKIIHLLRDALFFDNDPPRSDEDRKARHDEAVHQLISYIPVPFVMAVGSSNHKEGTELVFKLLQQPRLNKHLSYVLLDHVLEELFPEVFCSSEDVQTPTKN